MYKNKIVSLVLVGLMAGTLVLANTARAQETDETSHPWPSRCDRLQHRIEDRLANFKEHRDNHIAKYERIVERSQHIIDTLREKGYDETLVSQLETDLITLKDMVHDFGGDVDAAMTALEAANDMNCGDSEGEFVRRLEVARDLFRVAREDAKSIKDFFKGTIKADIQALKDWKKAQHTPQAIEVSPLPIPSPVGGE